MRDSVPIARYSSVCNVLRQWRIWLIPTYRVYRLYDSTRIHGAITSLSRIKKGPIFFDGTLADETSKLGELGLMHSNNGG